MGNSSASKDIKLGYNTGYWGSGPPQGALEGIKEADRLGFDSVWTAEAYGSDALTPLAWWGAQTQNVRLGTGIIQMSARTPSATAMAAMTIDHLSNGRFILGLGASGPQVVEGWYGQPYPKPLARTREYVEVVRSILKRDKPIDHHGEFFDIPTPDELIFISSFTGGEVFRSGATWRRGLGKVFYFSPGDQDYPVYHQKEIGKVLANGVVWARPVVRTEPIDATFHPDGWIEKN